MSIVKYVSSILFLLLIAACKSTNSPKAVTETFLVSVARLDIKTAKNYSTKDSWEFLKILDKATKDLSLEQKEAYLKNFKVNIISEKKLNDSTMLVKFTTTPRLLPMDELQLKAEKNLEGKIKWKVFVSNEKMLAEDTTIQEVMMPSFDSISEVNVADSAAE